MSSHGQPYFKGIAMIAAGAVCWSTAGLIVRHIEAGAWQITFWRSTFMAMALLGLLLVQGRSALAGVLAAGRSMIVSGVLLAATFIFFILALDHTPLPTR